MKKWTSGLVIALSCAMLVQPLGVAAEETAIESETVAETVIETEMAAETDPSETEIESETAVETEIETEPGEAKIEETETIPETELEVQEETAEEAEASGVEGFVGRLYSVVLGRKASASEKANWINLLKTKQMSGAEVAKGFVDSNELKARNLSDSAYIDMLYQTFMNRSADAGGKKTWQDILDKGMSRMYVFAGFAESTEFENICKSYGIVRGNANLTEARDKNMGVTTFVVRCYDVFLGRKPDVKGLNEWCQWILNGEVSPKDAAYGFVFSNEFMNKKTGNSDYVKILYNGFFDRTADNSGLNSWVKILEDGNSRESVFYGFADSQEFRTLVGSFGLNNNWTGTPVNYIKKAEACDITVKFERIITRNYKEYGVITGYDKNNNSVWTYTTKKYPKGQLDWVSEIGQWGTVYYFVDHMTVKALDANTGKQLWSNSDFGGGLQKSIIDADNGNAYMCGGLGPAFYAVTSDGRSLMRSNNFDGGADLVTSFEKVGDTIRIEAASSTGVPCDRYLVIVNLDNFTYSKQYLGKY